MTIVIEPMYIYALIYLLMDIFVIYKSDSYKYRGWELFILLTLCILFGPFILLWAIIDLVIFGEW